VSLPKLKIIVVLLLSFVIVPAFATPLSDRTGLKNEFPIQLDNQTFNVITVANFDVQNLSFKDGHLVFSIQSSLNNNLGEIEIPNGLANGNLTFTLDGKQLTPKILHNERIAFVTLEFQGNGTHTLDVKGQTNLKLEVDDSKVSLPKIESSDDWLIVISVIGIVVASGAATTVAVYSKRKKS